MLEYEKKLHLDKNWEKMQSMHFGKNLISILMSIFTYAVTYILLKKVLIAIPDLTPWGNCKIVKTFWGIFFRCVDMIYIVLGLIMYSYGSIKLIRINKENHSVRDEAYKPTKLLINGCYASARQPMYGVFVVRTAAVLLALRSLIGIVIAILFWVLQYINARWEENRELIPLFHDDYVNYRQKVTNVLFKKWKAIFVVVMIIGSCIGLFVC